MELTANKKINDFTDINKKIDMYDFANLFNVVELGNKSYYNINNTIRFENIDYMPENLYTNYEITLADTWTNISYRFYKTIKLWWLICKFNGIENPLTDLIPGKIIKIPNENVVHEILMNIK